MGTEHMKLGQVPTRSRDTTNIVSIDILQTHLLGSSQSQKKAPDTHTEGLELNPHHTSTLPVQIAKLIGLNMVNTTTFVGRRGHLKVSLYLLIIFTHSHYQQSGGQEF
jgi:hypothetical protein